MISIFGTWCMDCCAVSECTIAVQHLRFYTSFHEHVICLKTEGGAENASQLLRMQPHEVPVLVLPEPIIRLILAGQWPRLVLLTPAIEEMRSVLRSAKARSIQILFLCRPSQDPASTIS